ncbi:MAG: cation diffusion facilitator family transporter [Dysgonamonadaceae bacterium]|nr:cation diffusion facilitator family transporter [Dysgonamonadaceae bacterium]MDD3309761.1 cation diffusion facilitator family transporter [Dysgonamonadaceae bacterium]MDD3901597.1 cation diffusion facilitator family transporter [Dysgonamonadaceae bacterium]MDD4400027.1 cation diffusion facilitator family transporter [Dysgonamonadaceae bacterium]
MKSNSLKKFIYLSIAAAVTTILLKFYAYYITGSMGLFSDALESCVNLIAAVIALVILNISEKPADKGHEFGHSKAEYFSSAIEGGLIMIAAFSIIWASVPKLINPTQLENVGVGLLFSVIASSVNLAVGLILIRNGKKNRSLLLEADGRHLMTDVWTTVGVIIGVALVKLTGWLILDPIIAIFVAVNIVITGFHLINRSANGLMDAAIPVNEIKKITDYLDSLKNNSIEYHSFMSRQAGQRKFISFHLLVPDEWSVKKGHDLAEQVEQTIENMFGDELINVITHLEPKGDPASLNDINIDRCKHDNEVPEQE